MLQDVEHILVRKQLSALYHRGDGAKYDEDDQDNDIKTIFKEELPAVKSVFVVLPLLGPLLHERELGHAQKVNEVVFVAKCSMLAIFCLLQGLLVLHLRIKAVIFVYVVFVFDLGSIREACKLGLMLFLKLA